MVSVAAVNASVICYEAVLSACAVTAHGTLRFLNMCRAAVCRLCRASALAPIMTIIFFSAGALLCCSVITVIASHTSYMCVGVAGAMYCALHDGLGAGVLHAMHALAMGSLNVGERLRVAVLLSLDAFHASCCACFCSC